MDLFEFKDDFIIFLQCFQTITFIMNISIVYWKERDHWDHPKDTWSLHRDIDTHELTNQHPPYAPPWNVTIDLKGENSQQLRYIDIASMSPY